MSIGAKIAIGVGAVLALGIVLYFALRTKPVYFTPEALAVLQKYKQNGRLRAFNEGLQEENKASGLPGQWWWDKACDKSSKAFGGTVCGENETGYWNRLNMDTILAWARGMNVNLFRGNPEGDRLLNLIEEPAIKEAIYLYYQTVVKKGKGVGWHGNQPIGAFYNVFNSQA